METREVFETKGLDPVSTTPAQSQLTQALLECRKGDREAFEQVVSLLYDDLRQVAHRQLGRLRFGHTLDTTVLVHEAYLKLNRAHPIASTDRAHFLAILGCAMRQVIVDYARQRHALKRGGDLARVTFDESEIAVDRDVDQQIALDDALARLGELDERLVRIVECRFYAGMTEQETADAMEVSRSTVQREWIRARAWLRHALGEVEVGGDDG